VVLLSLFVAGGIADNTFQRGLILIPLYLLGTWSGSRLFAIAPEEYFKRVALWLLMATGVGIVLLG
jgi:uncharacterized membrane protein YfcA